MRKSSTSSDRSTSSLHSHSSFAVPHEDEERATAELGEDTDESAASSSGSSGPRFMLSTANTMTASFTLMQEQLAYLISVNHPNIQHHFFASFLTRDHALHLLDGILRQKHGRDGFTSLSSPSPSPTPAASSSNSPASQTRSISKDVSGGSAEKDRRSKKGLPTAQPVGSSSADSTHLSAGSSSDDQQSMLLPASASQELPTSLSFSTSSYQSTAGHSQLPSSHSMDALSALHTPSRSSAADTATAAADESHSGFIPRSPSAVDDASQTDGGDEWASADDGPATLVVSLDFGGPDMQPPLGEYNDSEDALLLDTTFSVDTVLFFHLFYADHAPFSLHSYHAQRATDSEFKMTRWRDIIEELPMSAVAESETKRREVEGDLLRRLSYRMQFVTPVGPPVTRVHRVQRWYAAGDRQHSGARLDSCSVTPDIMFGDQVVILERMYVEPLPSSSSGSEQSTVAEAAAAESIEGQQVRVRVHGGVRFKSRPWKMKPFIGLIQQRSREDVKAGVEQWEQFVKRRMLEEPDKVEACRKRVAALRGKSALEQLLPKEQPGRTQKGIGSLPSGLRSQSPHASQSHATASSAGMSSRFLQSSSRGTSTLAHLTTSAHATAPLIPAALLSPAQSAGQPSPASQTLSTLPTSFASQPRPSVVGAVASAASHSSLSAYWLSVRPTVRRLLPGSLGAAVVGRMDAANVSVSRWDEQQRAGSGLFRLLSARGCVVRPGLPSLRRLVPVVCWIH